MLLALLALAACQSADEAEGDDDGAMDAGTDGDADGDTDADADSDSDTDTNNVNDAGEIILDCTQCPATGESLEAMACAFEMCDGNLLLDMDYGSPSGSTTAGTRIAVNHFGSETNGLAPRGNDSYTLIATGPATGTSHSTPMGGAAGIDPWANDQYASSPTHDIMQWSMVLKAPDGAHGFSFLYVYFSEEYDDYIGTSCNDKFYVFLEAGSTNDGNQTIINFTECRDAASYHDFQCPAGVDYCDEGDPYCYIAINSALSDCCWYNGCPDGYSSQVGTDITGTGFECASSQGTDSSTFGSSTGWLRTQWPIDPGETFKLTFHIMDVCDGIFDSEVILDDFHFLGTYTPPSTTPVE
jgi:hypothetical protein